MAETDHFRAFARRPVSLPGRLLGEESDWEEEVNLVDLGLGGAGVLMRAPIAEATAVRLRVIAPNLWDPLILPGEVVWCGPPDGRGTYRVGLAFRHESGPRLRALVDLIASTAYE